MVCPGSMRFRLAIKYASALGLVFILLTISLWTSCSDHGKQIIRNEIGRKVDSVRQDPILSPHLQLPQTNSVHVGDAGGVPGADRESSVPEGSFFPVDCLINDEYTVHCCKEADEVYMPFSFIRDYFEVFGKFESSDNSGRFAFQHSDSKIHTPRRTYSPRGPFMSFEFYHVERRARVKFISAIEGVPISTQWNQEGHFYPIQIAQFGLSHYSKHAGGEQPRVLVLEDGDSDGTAATWARPDNRTTMQFSSDPGVGSSVVQFSSSDALRNPGLLMMVDEKDNCVMSVDILFTSNGSLTVSVETQSGHLLNIHYVLSNTLITMDGSDVIYGLGLRLKEWIHLTRDVKLDLEKGCYVKSNGKHCRTKYAFSHIRDIAVHGHGLLDNLTLSPSAHMDHFYDAARWLVRHQDSNGGWPITVRRKLMSGVVELAPGWYSAMAQGQAMSLLVRAYLVSGDPRYLTSACQATKIFQVSSQQGGVLARFMNAHDWYEEYPTSPSSFVLNGFIYSLLGLYDLKQVASGEDGARAARLYDAGMSSLRSMLLMFDTGSGSLYDLRHLGLGCEPNRARWEYHATHINQLLQLVVIDEDPLFRVTVKRWIGYMRGRRAHHN